MQSTMEVLYAAMFLFSITAGNTANLCFKIQEVNSEIEVLLPHRNCDKFYQCANGEPVEMSCPKGLLYSIIERRCEWRDHVKCGDRIIPEDREPEVTQKPGENDSVHTTNPEVSVIDFLQNGCPVDPTVHWLLPHEKVCSLFYYCDRGERELRRCPFRLNFNRKSQVCDWPRNADCLERI